MGKTQAAMKFLHSHRSKIWFGLAFCSFMVFTCYLEDSSLGDYYLFHNNFDEGVGKSTKILLMKVSIVTCYTTFLCCLTHLKPPNRRLRRPNLLISLVVAPATGIVCAELRDHAKDLESIVAWFAFGFHFHFLITLFNLKIAGTGIDSASNFILFFGLTICNKQGIDIWNMFLLTLAFQLSRDLLQWTNEPARFAGVNNVEPDSTPVAAAAIIIQQNGSSAPSGASDSTHVTTYIGSIDSRDGEDDSGSITPEAESIPQKAPYPAGPEMAK